MKIALQDLLLNEENESWNSIVQSNLYERYLHFVCKHMEKRQEESHPIGHWWPWKNVGMYGVKDDSHILLLYYLTILGEALINLFLLKPK